MTSFTQKLGLTAWRKKNIILLGVAAVSLILFGLQYSVVEDQQLINEERDAKGVEAALLHSIKVKFIEVSNKFSSDNLVNYVQTTTPSYKNEEVFKRQTDRRVNSRMETDQQLGIPYINIETKTPFVPKQRIVHFDLKGAPPTVNYFKKVISLAKNAGATGILLEYEDMFPFTGNLSHIAAKNAYSLNQIKDILKSIEDLKMDVIPLVQTFGHMEFALKHKEFEKIREVLESPQSLCPSRNKSLEFISELVGQVLELHPNVKYFHIGCDEVLEMGQCDLCVAKMQDNLFLDHVQNIAKIVHAKNPNLQLIMWDDMLRHIPLQDLQAAKLGDIVEPMVWVYAEDIYRFVQPPIWDKFAAVFKTVWAASAFKGAFGETLYVPNARRHLENNLRWLEVMETQSSFFKNGISGIVLTGWQRYDHFAVLCELLPAAIPSLTLNLLAVTHGYFNSSLRDAFLTNLNCPQPSGSSPLPFITLESDPNMWERLSRCMFAGHGFFKVTYRLHNLETELKEYLETTTRNRGWMTAYNVKHNYSLPSRVDELTQDLSRLHHNLVSLAKSTQDALTGVVDNYTISEWIEQRIFPYILELEKIQNQSHVLKSVKHWPARPLPILKDLEKHGIFLGRT